MLDGLPAGLAWDLHEEATRLLALLPEDNWNDAVLTGPQLPQSLSGCAALALRRHCGFSPRPAQGRAKQPMTATLHTS
ncbi:hypothetical protein [Paracoccus seriniphilus]|uniref:hypothetical protein n=1 Tax=Paracoccus seriniphilus TaxID=184748 RepID=UPI00356B5FCE